MYCLCVTIKHNNAIEDLNVNSTHTDKQENEIFLIYREIQSG